jgi:hypothetical protein
LEATLAYREFPFVIRRRDHAAAGGERVRISEALRWIQRDLGTFESLMRVERAGEVATSYRTLVAKTREIAGAYMTQEWGRAPIIDDEQMSVGGDFDYNALARFEKSYLEAVAKDLAWWRFWR